jgi:hypothetical protein
METMTTAEFTAFLSRTDWKTEQEIHLGGEGERDVEQWDEASQSFEQTTALRATGYASLISTVDEVRITYSESFEYDCFEGSSLKTSCEGIDDVWEIEGIEIRDENGETLDWPDFADMIPNAFSRIDYSELNIDQITDIDSTPVDGVDQVTIKNDRAPSLRFSGTPLGSVCNQVNRRVDETERQFKLALYQSAAGKYVCERVGYARWPSENDFHQAQVCDTVADVKAFFGERPLAKELYQLVGL